MSRTASRATPCAWARCPAEERDPLLPVGVHLAVVDPRSREVPEAGGAARTGGELFRRPRQRVAVAGRPGLWRGGAGRRHRGQPASPGSSIGDLPRPGSVRAGGRASGARRCARGSRKRIDPGTLERLGCRPPRLPKDGSARTSWPSTASATYSSARARTCAGRDSSSATASRCRRPARRLRAHVLRRGQAAGGGHDRGLVGAYCGSGEPGPRGRRAGRRGRGARCSSGVNDPHTKTTGGNRRARRAAGTRRRNRLDQRPRARAGARGGAARDRRGGGAPERRTRTCGANLVRAARPRADAVRDCAPAARGAESCCRSRSPSRSARHARRSRQ